MITLAELVVKLLADAEGYSKTFNDAEEKATGLGSHIGGIAGTIGKALGGALLAGGTALLGGLTASVVAAADAEKGVAQLEAVIQSTGGKAGVTAQAALDLASSLQKVTTFEDDTVLSAENMLLTFTNIHSEVFPQATETALNLAQAMGGDVKGASIQLGKALNDPITGITALTRVGVTFTEAQKAQIKALQESGDMMGAQKIVLAELATEFGGAARAAGSTFSGQLAILKNSLGDIAEEVGGRILPVITPLVSQFKDFAIAALPQVSAALDVVVPKIVDGLGWAINFVTANFSRVRDVVVGVFDAIVAWVNLNIMPTINNVLIPLFWRVVDFVVSNWPLVRDAIVGAFNAIVAYTNANLIPALLRVWEWVSGYWPLVRDTLVGAFWDVVGYLRDTVVPFITGTVLPMFQQAWAWIVANWPLVRDTIVGAFWDVVAWVQANIVPFINNTLLPAFERVWSWIAANWPFVRDTVIKVFWDVVDWVKANILPMFSSGGTVTTAFGAVVKWFNDTWATVSDVVNRVWAAIVDFFNTYVAPFLNNYVIPAFMAVVTWVESWWPKVKEVIVAVFEAIKTVYHAVLQPVLEFLLAQVMKVVNWIAENWPLIQKTVETVVGAIVKVVSWLISEITKIFTGDGQGAVSAFAAIFNRIGAFVGSTVDFVLALLKALMQVITGDFEGAAQTMNKGLADLLWAGLNLWTMILDTLINVVRNAMVRVVDLIGGQGFAQKLGLMIGVDLNKSADLLGALGITKDSIYSALNVNNAPTTEPQVHMINGMGTNGGMTVINNITTKDDPTAIAEATAREIRMQQVLGYAP